MPRHARIVPVVLGLAAALWPGAASAARADEGDPPPAPAAGAPEEPAPAPPASAEPVLHQTTADEVRVRAGPSVNYRVLERLPRGAWLLVTGTEGEWLRVRVPGGVPAYLHPDLAGPVAEGKAPVTKTDVLLRPTPGKEYFPLEGQRLQPGDEVRVLGTEAGESGEWLRVLPPERVEVWVHGSLVEPVTAADGWREEYERRALERRDAYTGGREAEAARAALKAREDGYAERVAAAERVLAETPVTAVPDGLPAMQDALKEVMTESGVADTRTRAAAVSRDLLLRERTVEVARLKAEKSAVRATLEERLAEAEGRYRAALAELLKATPRAAEPRWLAMGTLRRSGDGYVIEKGGVPQHDVDSLRYDLSELVGRHVGVNGRRIEVDPARRRTLLRIDALEILE